MLRSEAGQEFADLLKGKTGMRLCTVREVVGGKMTVGVAGSCSGASDIIASNPTIMFAAVAGKAGNAFTTQSKGATLDPLGYVPDVTLLRARLAGNQCSFTVGARSAFFRQSGTWYVTRDVA